MSVPDAYRWVPTRSDGGNYPDGKLVVGADIDGAELIAGRAQHEGDLLPAKIIPSKDVCYVSRAGKEYVKDKFEVFVPKRLSWVHHSNGFVPPNAVEVGRTACGEKLYYGRVPQGEFFTSGKIQPSLKVCFYSYRGEELKSHEYQVLVESE